MDADASAVEPIRKRLFGAWQDRDRRRNATIETARLGYGLTDCAIFRLCQRLLRNPAPSGILGCCSRVERPAGNPVFQKRTSFSTFCQNQGRVLGIIYMRGRKLLPPFNLGSPFPGGRGTRRVDARRTRRVPHSPGEVCQGVGRERFQKCKNLSAGTRR
jgi:hypothetical protein